MGEVRALSVTQYCRLIMLSDHVHTIEEVTAGRKRPPLEVLHRLASAVSAVQYSRQV